jgi:hypothetical protein
MNSSRRTLAVALFALIALGAAPILRAQGVSLKYRWTKGEVLNYRSTIKSHVVMSGVPGMGEMTVGTTITQMTKMTTEDVAADGSATVRNLIESMKMEMATPMGTMTYDSAAPAAAGGDPMMDAFAKSIGVMVGESFTMVMTPAGKVLKIDGMSKILEKAKANAPEAVAALGAAGGLEAMMGDDAQRSSLEQTFVGFPAAPVKTGETWKSEVKIPNAFGAMTAAFTFTMKGVTTEAGREVAQIANAGTIKATAGGAPGVMGPMTVTMGDGTSTGEALFDVKRGRMQKATTVVNLPMTMSMASPDGTNISLQAASTITTTIELIEK